MNYCETAKKKIFTSEGAARKGATQVGNRIRVYPCGGHYHITSQDKIQKRQKRQ